MAVSSIALQLFTVREALAEDYVGTLKKVKEIGYDDVQLTGNMPYNPGEMKKILNDVGLTARWLHLSLEKLEHELEKWIVFAHTVGVRELTCPSLPEERRKTAQDWLDIARTLDGIGARCRKQGLRLSYHNHSFEFTRFDGTYGLDLLYENSDPENLYAELDTYWIKHGGERPEDYIRKYSGRIKILHIKDMAADEERSFAEIGSGILDWPAIHKAALTAGVECYCIEQDTCKRDPFVSIALSLAYTEQLVEAYTAA